jgi:hypothetical protein
MVETGNITGTPAQGVKRAVWLCNTDVESEWAEAAGERPPRQDTQWRLFQRFEEILLPSVGSEGIAILRAEPDPQFLSYLTDLGLDLPEVVIPRGSERSPWETTTRLVSEDQLLVRDLASEVRSGSCATFEPFGVSQDIEWIAAHTGLCLAGTDADLAASLSRKSSARRLASNLGLLHPDGEICDRPADLPHIVRSLRRAGAGAPVVIKPDLAASGRGQRLIRSEGDEHQLADAVNRGELGSAGAVHVIERWYPVQTTLTYELQVDPTSRRPEPVALREALGRPRHSYGYLSPARTSSTIQNILDHTSAKLMSALRSEHGYAGPVRCDALVLEDGRVMPLLEMNARHSFFFFLDKIQARLLPGSPYLFRWLHFRSPGKLTFDTLIEQRIGHDLLFDHGRCEGVVVPMFGTLTADERAAVRERRAALRRLFVLVLAATTGRAYEIADKLRQRWQHLE